MRKSAFGVATAALLAFTLPALAQGLPGDAPPADMDQRIAEADKHPLGSEKNPIRVDMPKGERAYLSRLRCADGNAPIFNRVGSMGVGPFDHIVDFYDVECTGSEPAKSGIYMDMYFPGHDETRAPPGFTLAPK